MRKDLRNGRVAQLKSKVNELKLLVRLLRMGVDPQVIAQELDRVQAVLYGLSHGNGNDA